MRYARVLVLAGVTALIMSCVGAALSNAGSDTVTYVFTTVIRTPMAALTKQKVGAVTIAPPTHVKSFTNVAGGKYEVEFLASATSARYIIVTYDYKPPDHFWSDTSGLKNVLLERSVSGKPNAPLAYNITVPSGTHTLYVGVSTGSESWTVTLYKWVQSSGSGSGVYNGQVTVHVVNDVVKVAVTVPKNIYVVRGGTTNITLKVTQTEGYTRYFSAQVSLPNHNLKASVTAANHIQSYSNEWRGNGTVTVTLSVPLSAEGGTQYVLNISIFASHDPADTYSSPPTPPSAVVYGGSSNVGDAWKLCGSIGFAGVGRHVYTRNHAYASHPLARKLCGSHRATYLAVAGMGVVAVAVVAAAVAAGGHGRRR